ncbi:hypothetical protein HPB50_016063 [Hyalomma asiaticum]|uniref:Uncharacterized protein n=1 Tax=Hyalomma asiaticum TaxID=266040 RepID=A0ACB7SG06_HYAAI|nr:hypothetical protein HPB50_016063 [Hyalomma asiaticum]
MAISVRSSLAGVQCHCDDGGGGMACSDNLTSLWPPDKSISSEFSTPWNCSRRRTTLEENGTPSVGVLKLSGTLHSDSSTSRRSLAATESHLRRPTPRNESIITGLEDAEGAFPPASTGPVRREKKQHFRRENRAATEALKAAAGSGGAADAHLFDVTSDVTLRTPPTVNPAPTEGDGSRWRGREDRGGDSGGKFRVDRGSFASEKRSVLDRSTEEGVKKSSKTHQFRSGSWRSWSEKKESAPETWEFAQLYETLGGDNVAPNRALFAVHH